MIAIAVLGGGIGFGAFLVLRRPAIRANFRAPRYLVRSMLRSGGTDRAILGITDDAYAAHVLMAGIFGLVSAVVVVTLSKSFGVGMPVVAEGAIVIVSPLLGVSWRSSTIKKRATHARNTFLYALSSYLDLVSVLLAGGAGSETALYAASHTGNSWSFRALRETLETARATRVPIWNAFADLGRRFGITDLERVAGSMQLAGEQGAKVRLSLATQAEALRARQISEIEAAAQESTERMGVPTVLLFVGFIALLGYPALDLVVGQM